MKNKLHKKIDSDRFPELTAKKRRQLQEDEERALRESSAKESYEWRESQTTKGKRGKKHIKYLYGKPLRSTPESEIERINKKHKKK